VRVRLGCKADESDGNVLMMVFERMGCDGDAKREKVYPVKEIKLM